MSATSRKYERLPQPKIIEVDIHVNIYPERRSFEATGFFMLQNKTAAPITQVHITNAQQSVKEISFDCRFHKVSQSARNFYTIYALETPLAPGEKAKMNFRVGYESKGFKDGNERPEFAYNGTFFDSGYFPDVGYNRNGELDDPLRRKEEHLGLLEERRCAAIRITRTSIYSRHHPTGSRITLL